jgi:Cof subfamily protein (haloacid dehalogenase superfamily)
MPVIVSDLDGTLLSPDHRLTERTIEALRAARAAGWIVVAATGRNPTSAMPLLGPHDVIDTLIGSNGSLVHDPVADTTIHRFPIDAAHLVDLFTSLDAGFGGLSYGWELAGTAGWDDGFDDIARQHDDLFMHAPGPRPNGTDPVTKVMVRHADRVGRHLADALEPLLPAPLTLGCSGVDFVEITGVGVDKSRAMAHVIEPLGFSAADVVAFGDNHNDLQMLSWAGHGVAVGNAVDAAKGAANEVIGHHRDNSVAAYIESLL